LSLAAQDLVAAVRRPYRVRNQPAPYLRRLCAQGVCREHTQQGVLSTCSRGPSPTRASRSLPE
jgi:hypothetical protein